MKCPKCNSEIDDKLLACPHCKKVLKLLCPACKTINKSNTCTKCGFTIISKCHQCGKINQTANEKCEKCGFSTHTSVAIASSNIDEFACITIEFPNFYDIKKALGSTKLFDKFKLRLDKLISNYAISAGVTRQLIDNIFVIRFNKDYSFHSSAFNAMNAAIEIQNLVTELNFKLNKTQNVTLQCKIAVLKRDINSKPNEYKSGFDIKLIYQNAPEYKLLNNLQIITDNAVYEAVCEKFSLSSLSANFIKNEMVMFFELKLKKYIKIPKETGKKDNEKDLLASLPQIPEEEEENFEQEPIYSVDAINFNELKCNFITTKACDIFDEISRKLKENNKNIINIKCDKHYAPKTIELINTLTQGDFDHIFRVTCTEEMKFKPYGFFYELISSIYNYTVSTKKIPLIDFSNFTPIDESGFIKDLICLNKREFPHPEDIRYSLFDIFFNIFYSMSKTMIYVENADKIDDTSLEVLQIILSKFNEFDVSYTFVSDKNFSLHKQSHFLLANEAYTELSVIPVKFAQIIAKEVNKFEDILNTYNFKQISQYTKGNPEYFKNAILYLKDLNIINHQENKYTLISDESAIIPANFNELIQKRLINLAKNENLYKLFAKLLLIGPRIDFVTISLLKTENDTEMLKILFEKEYVYIHNSSVYIQNYAETKEIFFNLLSYETKKELAQDVLEKVFMGETYSPNDAILLNLLQKEKSEFLAWEKLSLLNASLGDFAAYLNCSIKFLKLIDNHIDENSQKTIEEYKMEVYENLSNLLYKYTPDKIQNIAQIILENIEKTTDDKKVLNLCNKMLQGCLISGNYTYALRLAHKILSKFPSASLDPNSKLFHIGFFLVSLVKIEILFSIGDFKDCIEASDEILNAITSENISKLKPQHLSTGQFEELLYDTALFSAISRIILLRPDLSNFIEKTKTIFQHSGPMPQTFELLPHLEELIHGAQLSEIKELTGFEDKFAKIISCIITAFTQYKDDYHKFANAIYQAKLSSKMHNFHQMELFCDLLIGYSYFNLGENKKASLIYYNVLEISTKNGLKAVTYVAWYLIALLKYAENDIDIAFGVANNAIIQIEKDENSTEFLLYILKILMAKIFESRNENEASQFCLNHGIFIKDKYGLNI